MIAQLATFALARRNAILCRRIAADHQPAPGKAQASTCPPAWPGRNEHVHGDLPGLLAAITVLPAASRIGASTLRRLGQPVAINRNSARYA